MDNQTMGRFIATRRKELGMTQKQLAEQLNITDRAISRWERGVGAPEILLIAPLSAALQISADELLDGAAKAAEPSPAPVVNERKAGIPLFYFYLRLAIVSLGCLVVILGAFFQTWLPISALITVEVIGAAIMIAGLFSMFLFYRCPLCGHFLEGFQPRASQYQIQRCRTCGKALYSDKTVRTPKEYLKYRKAR